MKPPCINVEDYYLQGGLLFMKRYIRTDSQESEIFDLCFCYTEYRNDVLASISSKDITKSMVRVKSSNVWAYNINIKNKKANVGDVYVQFKGEHGGPGDIYVLYDVPVSVYRRWHSATSAGSYYWRYLRNKYYYSKLTGDKRGKLKNAINH